ncbi:MAG: ThiF family adenylyltransferase, partial [Desulfobacterales bacterium]
KQLLAAGPPLLSIRKRGSRGRSGSHILKLSEMFQVSGLDIEITALEENIIPEHYARNMKTFSAKEQSTLLSAQVSIVGLGGLGGAVTEILARVGIGRLSLIEADMFEESNLNRQFLSTHRRLETSKTKAAVKRVREINPAVVVNGYDEFLYFCVWNCVK